MDLKNKKTEADTKKRYVPDTVLLVAAALLAWVGCYLFTMRLGAVTSYPLILVTSFISAIFIRGYFRSAVFYAVFGFVLPFTSSRGLYDSALLGAVCFLIFSLSFASVFCLKLKKRKKLLLCCLSVLLAAAAIALHVFFNSDPFTFGKNESIIDSHIEANYKYEKQNRSNVYYDYAEQSFITEVSYSKRPTERALISVSNGKLSDGYIGLTEGFMLENSVQDLTSKLRKAFPTGNFAVTAGSILNYPRNMAVSAENTFDYSPYSTYNVFFRTSMNADDFITLAERYYNAVLESGFDCAGLVFHAGSAGRYYAKIETRFLSMKARFENKIVKEDAELRRLS